MIRFNLFPRFGGEEAYDFPNGSLLNAQPQVIISVMNTEGLSLNSNINLLQRAGRAGIG